MTPTKIIAGVLVTGAIAGSAMIFIGTAPTTTLPEIDYKFWYIKRCDDVHICEAAVRYFEGTTTTAVIPATLSKVTGTTTIPAQATTTVYTYVRTKHLQRADLTQFATATFIKEANGSDDVVYTPKDFGTISTDAELQAFLNIQLAKDPTRTPIPQQKAI